MLRISFKYDRVFNGNAMKKLTVIEKINYLAVGFTDSNGLCDICIEVPYGHFRFGIFNSGNLAINYGTELEDLLYMIRNNYYTFAEYTQNKRIYRKYDNSLFYGLCATKETPSCGIHFFADGRVFAGCSYSQNITGCYAYICNKYDGIQFGIFRNAILHTQISKEEFVKTNFSEDSEFTYLFKLAKISNGT